MELPFLSLGWTLPKRGLVVITIYLFFAKTKKIVFFLQEHPFPLPRQQQYHHEKRWPRSTSFPGELWVPFVAGSQQDFCSVGHSDTALLCILPASPKKPSLLMGVSATFPKNPGRATVWGQEGPERAGSPTLSGRAGSC